MKKIIVGALIAASLAIPAISAMSYNGGEENYFQCRKSQKESGYPYSVVHGYICESKDKVCFYASDGGPTLILSYCDKKGRW